MPTSRVSQSGFESDLSPIRGCLTLLLLYYMSMVVQLGVGLHIQFIVSSHCLQANMQRSSISLRSLSQAPSLCLCTIPINCPSAQCPLSTSLTAASPQPRLRLQSQCLANPNFAAALHPARTYSTISRTSSSSHSLCPFSSSTTAQISPSTSQVRQVLLSWIWMIALFFFLWNFQGCMNLRAFLCF